MCENNKRPSLKAIFSNWKESEASFGRKIKMATRNNLLKVKAGKSCCGNYGEVGC